MSDQDREKICGEGEFIETVRQMWVILAKRDRGMRQT